MGPEPTPRNRFFYNTNGFAFHRLEDAVRLLATLGYGGVAWTPDVHHLDPLTSTDEEIDAFGKRLRQLDLEIIVETGARFVLDPRRKHRPSLLDDRREAAVRLAFLERCVDLAARLGAPVVSTWSGNGPSSLSPTEGMDRLVGGLGALCRHGEARGVAIGFEPEPAMLIERVAAWPALKAAVDHPALGLTLDVGHCLATREGSPADALRSYAADLLVLHLDDHRPGVHEHLAFGDGVVDFPALANAVRDVNYAGPLEVELSRHAATAPATAAAAVEFLARTFGRPGSRPRSVPSGPS